MKSRISFYFFVILLMVPVDSVRSGDWGQFRGPNGSGTNSKLGVPDNWSMGNVVWKVDSGNGGSSLVASKDKLFITSYENDTRTLRCLNALSGKELWSKSIPKLRKETATPPNDPAMCTPVCDDSVVCAWFPDAGLIACSLDGELKWQKDLGPFYSMHGISASPVLMEGKLIVTVDQLQNPYVVALDTESGKEIWKAERLIGITGGYSSPAYMALDHLKLVVSAGPGELVAYDLKTGERKLTCTGLTNAPVGLPVVQNNRIYYSEPPGEPIPMEALGGVDQNNDGVIELEEVKGSIGTYRLVKRIDNGFGNADGKVDKTEWDKAFGTFLNNGGLSCVELNQKDGVVDSKVVWKYNKTTPYIPSLLVIDGIVYIINDGGILMSFDAASGEMIKRSRLSDATGKYYSSPVSDGQRILFANFGGKISLVQSGREWKALSTLDLEESIVASPSIQNGRLYIRTETQLYCFGDKG